MKHLSILLCAAILTITTHAQQQLWSGKYDFEIMHPQKVGFSSDSKYFAVGSNNGYATIYTADSGLVYDNLHLNSSHVFCTLFQPGGTVLALGDKEGYIVFYDYAARKEIKTTFGHMGGVLAMAFSADGKYLLTGGNDKIITVWNPLTGERIKTINSAEHKIHALAITNDNRSVYAATTSLLKGLRQFDFNSGTQVHEYESANVQTLAVSADNNYLATANLNKLVPLFLLKTGALKTNLAGHTRYVNDICFSPSGKFLFSGGNDKEVMIFSLWDKVNTIEFFKTPDAIHTLAVAPNGKYLAVLDAGNTFYILNATEYQ